MQVSGVIVPMVTPSMGRQDEVDHDTLAELTRMLVDGGVHGLFPCGSVGEFSSLTDVQRDEVIETVVENSGSLPVFAGCGDTNVAGVCERMKSAATVGADCAVVVTPYYLGTDQTALQEFYEAIATDAPLPIILYNIPVRTGVRLMPSTVTELADVAGIIGIKDTSWDMTYHRRLIVETSDDFAVLQGGTNVAVGSLDVGSDGLVPAPENVYPSVITELYEAHAAGNRDRAVAAMSEVVHPVIDGYTDIPTAAALKHLLTLREIDAGPPFIPTPELNTSQREKLKARHREVITTAAAYE